MHASPGTCNHEHATEHSSGCGLSCTAQQGLPCCDPQHRAISGLIRVASCAAPSCQLSSSGHQGWPQPSERRCCQQPGSGHTAASGCAIEQVLSLQQTAQRYQCVLMLPAQLLCTGSACCTCLSWSRIQGLRRPSPSLLEVPRTESASLHEGQVIPGATSAAQHALVI